LGVNDGSFVSEGPDGNYYYSHSQDNCLLDANKHLSKPYDYSMETKPFNKQVFYSSTSAFFYKMLAHQASHG
jgi:hypothetical protein